MISTTTITSSRLSLDSYELKLPVKYFEASSSSSSIDEISQLLKSIGDTSTLVSDTTLPPTDHGFHAWAYLASAWLFELLVWSFPNSYGVFLNYYNTTAPFGPNHPQAYLLPVVGTLSSGIVYLASLPVLLIMLRYPAHKQMIPLAGIFLCVGSFVGTAFSNTPVQLILTQGVLYGLGGTTLYFPILTYLPEWFVHRRGLANGILFSGTGLGGVFVPFIIETLLKNTSHRNACLALASIYGLLALPAYFYAKPRLPPAKSMAATDLDGSFLCTQVFWVFFVSNFMQASVNVLPAIYIPSFATDLGLNTTQGTLAIALMNTTRVPGLIIMGGLSDKLDLGFSIALSTVASSIAVLLGWGFACQLAPLLVFACMYGFFAGGFSLLWPKFIAIIIRDDDHLYSTLMSLFVASRGLGNVLSGPLSTVLMRHSFAHGKEYYGYGVEGYGSLILFSGLGMLASTFAATYPLFLGKTINISRIASCFRCPQGRVKTDDENTA